MKVAQHVHIAHPGLVRRMLLCEEGEIGTSWFLVAGSESIDNLRRIGSDEAGQQSICYVSENAEIAVIDCTHGAHLHRACTVLLVSHKILNTPRHGLDMVVHQFVKIAILVLLIDDKLTSCLLVTDRYIRLKHI